MALHASIFLTSIAVAFSSSDIGNVDSRLPMGGIRHLDNKSPITYITDCKVRLNIHRPTDSLTFIHRTKMGKAGLRPDWLPFFLEHRSSSLVLRMTLRLPSTW
jgi:hypothetical protein